jgi:hypothetical protein
LWKILGYAQTGFVETELIGDRGGALHERTEL